jgi:hypothetical protein
MGRIVARVAAWRNRMMIWGKAIASKYFSSHNNIPIIASYHDPCYSLRQYTLFS